MCIYAKEFEKSHSTQLERINRARVCIVGSIERDYVCKLKLYEYGDKSCMKL